MLMALNQTYKITEETFESLQTQWLDAQHRLKWDCLFVLPGWLKTWWDCFGGGQVPYLCSVRSADELIGIAPLMIEAQTASFVGKADVCDYLDVIVIPGRSPEFVEMLSRHLSQQGVAQLDLGAVRADSIVFKDLIPAAKELGYHVTCAPEDVSMELELPGSWDDFLNGLTGKERHEIRRKLRRLNEAAQVNFRVVEHPDEISKEINNFFALFKMNRSDKSDFMTDQRASFFRTLAAEMADAGIFKLFFLDLDDKPAAAVMCFDFHSTRYLYNNGYDQRHQSLSVGLLSKVFTIKESIQSGISKYDFLKGTEPYKKRLGGKPVQLYRCGIDLV